MLDVVKGLLEREREGLGRELATVDEELAGLERRREELRVKRLGVEARSQYSAELADRLGKELEAIARREKANPSTPERATTSGNRNSRGHFVRSSGSGGKNSSDN